MMKMPVKVIFEIESVKQLENVLDTFEKIRSMHSDTIINAEIRVHTEN